MVLFFYCTKQNYSTLFSKKTNYQLELDSKGNIDSVLTANKVARKYFSEKIIKTNHNFPQTSDFKSYADLIEKNDDSLMCQFTNVLIEKFESSFE